MPISTILELRGNDMKEVYCIIYNDEMEYRDMTEVTDEEYQIIRKFFRYPEENIDNKKFDAIYESIKYGLESMMNDEDDEMETDEEWMMNFDDPNLIADGRTFTVLLEDNEETTIEFMLFPDEEEVLTAHLHEPLEVLLSNEEYAYLVDEIYDRVRMELSNNYHYKNRIGKISILI